MPNWCSTDITIRRAKEQGAKPLFDLIEKWQREGTKIKNSWDNQWLGLLVEKGLGANPLSHEYECRGMFYDLELSPDEEEITVRTETAWCPMLKMWIHLIDRHLPGDKLIYVAEECGCEIYQTNDPEYEGMYYIDSWGEVETKWIADEKAVRQTVNKLTGKDVSKMDIDKVIKLVSFEGHEVSIHKWDYDSDISWAA
ncbi:MAG: hypothetical protein IJI51_03550 [Lachnospiraceae bacterium]|nr:hypothetical protein [Lachnospiraceae bacterium]